MKIDKRKDILFYDSDWNGHHSEFILHLINFFEKTLDDYKDCQVFFLLNPKMKEHINIKQINICQINYLNDANIEIVTKKQHSLIRGYREWGFLKKFINRHQINHVFLMYIDLYLFKIGFLKNQNISISGIQFLPYFRMPQNSKRQRLRRTWHSWKIKWAARNENLKTVSILNDHLSVNELNRFEWHNNLFKYLPDPINFLNERIEIERIQMELNSLRRDKFTLLVFGHISMRKNIFNIMRALRLLEPNIQDKLQLLIVGEVDLTYQNIFEQLISDFVKDIPNLLILKIEKFVTVSEMNYIFEQSDYLLMPYTNAYKSSGIIGLAAKHEKLIIGPNTGVMHDLIQDYKLGSTVNPYDVNELKSVIELLGNNEERQLKSDFDRYIEERKPTEFSKTIFNVLLSYF